MELHSAAAGADTAFVRETLRERGRSFRRIDLGRRLTASGAALLLCPLFVVMLDHAVRGGLPRLVIAGAGLLWMVAVVVAIAFCWARSRRPRSDRFLAHDLEQVFDIRHNLVLNAVDVHHDVSYPYANEKADQQTADALRQPHSPQPVRLVPGRNAWLMLAVAAVWVGYMCVSGKPVWPSLARFFGFNVAAPTATRLELTAPAAGAALYRDEPLLVEVVARGAPVDGIVFERLPGDSAAADMPVSYAMVRGEDVEDAQSRTWRLTLMPNELAEVLAYRIRGGDAVLRGAFNLHEPPRLLGWRVDLTPPAYTHRPAVASEAEEIETIAGTRAVFTATAAAPMHDPIFVLRTDNGDVRTRMTPDRNDPTRASVAVQLTTSGRYWAIFGDEWGRQTASEPARQLIVRPDAPPEVTIESPTRADAPDDRVDVTYTAWIRAAARDDVGLDDASVVIERAGDELRRELPIEDRSELKVALPTSEFSLDEGETARLWFEARDARQRTDGKPAAQVTRSRVLTLTRSALPEQPPAEPTGDSEGEGAAGQGTAGEGVSAENGAAQPGKNGQAGESSGTAGGSRPGDVGDPQAASGPSGGGDASAGGRSGQGDAPAASGGDRGKSPAADGGDFEHELREFVDEFGRELPKGDDHAEQGGKDQPTKPAGSGEPADSAEPPKTPPDDSATTQPSEPRPDSDQPKADQPPDEGDSQAEENPQQKSDSENAADNDQPDSDEPAASQPSDETGQNKTQGGQSDDQDAESSRKQGEPPPKPNATSAGNSTDDKSNAGEHPGGGPRGQTDTPQEPPDSAPQPSDASEGSQTDAANGEQPSGGDQPSDNDRSGAAAEIKRVMELLSQPDLTEEDMIESGLSPERAHEFVKRIERLRALAERSGVLADPAYWRSRATLGSKDISHAGAGGPQGSSEAAAGQAFDDRLTEIVAPRDQHISPELRAILDAYYRSIAEHAAHDKD